MKVLLVDPETNIRYGLKTFFETLPEFSITGEVENIADLFITLKSCNPDIILLSLQFPEMIYEETVQKLKKLYPAAKIFGMDTNTDLKQYAISMGADGFISKADLPENMILTIKNTFTN